LRDRPSSLARGARGVCRAPHTRVREARGGAVSFLSRAPGGPTPRTRRLRTATNRREGVVPSLHRQQLALVPQTTAVGPAVGSGFAKRTRRNADVETVGRFGLHEERRARRTHVGRPHTGRLCATDQGTRGALAEPRSSRSELAAEGLNMVR
jgi:hypothetical protein